MFAKALCVQMAANMAADPKSALAYQHPLLEQASLADSESYGRNAKHCLRSQLPKKIRK